MSQPPQNSEPASQTRASGPTNSPGNPFSARRTSPHTPNDVPEQIAQSAASSDAVMNSPSPPASSPTSGRSDGWPVYKTPDQLPPGSSLGSGDAPPRTPPDHGGDESPWNWMNAVGESPTPLPRKMPELVVDVTPFGPPTESSSASLWDLLRVQLPPLPPTYKAATDGETPVLSGTKRLSGSVARTPHSLRLSSIVYAPNMLDRVLATLKKRLAEIKFDWTIVGHRLFVTAFHPFWTSRRLPKRIHSEKDIEAWLYSVIFRPALAIAFVVKAGKIPGDQTACVPYLSSAVQDPAEDSFIPDITLVLGGKYPNYELGFRAEAKAEDVLFHDNRLPTGREHIFERLARPVPDAPLGRAVKFRWPRGVDRNSKQTSIITQVWQQVANKKTNNTDKHHNVLSSYAHTNFLVRQGKTLYVSKTYSNRDEVLLMACALTAMSMGLIPKDVDLPPVDTSMWPVETIIPGTSLPSGIVPETLPPAAV